MIRAKKFIGNTFGYLKNLGADALLLKTAVEDLPTEKLLFDFMKVDSIMKWGTGYDQDIGGYSKAFVDYNERDKSLKFYGTLSLALNSSSDAMYSGYVALRTRNKERQHLFDGRTFDCTGYKYIILQAKGDHRTYSFNFKTTNSFSGDLYVTKFKFNNPYEWENVILPIDYFLRTNCGVEYMRQHPPNMQKIQSFGFLLSDNLPGPFNLELKSIKLSNLEDEAESLNEEQFQTLITQNLSDPSKIRQNWSDYQEGVNSMIGFDMGNGMIESRQKYAKRLKSRFQNADQVDHPHFEIIYKDQKQ